MGSVNLTRCMRYWDDYSSDSMYGASQERQTSRVVCVGLPFLGPKTVPDMMSV